MNVHVKKSLIYTLRDQNQSDKKSVPAMQCPSINMHDNEKYTSLCHICTSLRTDVLISVYGIIIINHR